MKLLFAEDDRDLCRAVKAMLDALKVGDRVCTIGGIYGTVTGVKDDQVIIAVGAQKTVMNMARWAIKSVEDAPLENDKSPEIYNRVSLRAAGKVQRLSRLYCILKR